MKLNLNRCVRGTTLACGIAVLLLAAGCERIAPVRTLPTWVRGIYIPMFENESFEPAIEETATRLTQEAFLADGRVNVVPREDADLILKAVIRDWRTRMGRSSGDKVAESEEVTLIADLLLYYPLDDEPLAQLPPIVLDSEFSIDTRSSRYTPEPDRKERLLEVLAQRIVNQTIDGYPAELAGLPPGAALPEIRMPEDSFVEKVLEQRRGEEYLR